MKNLLFVYNPNSGNGSFKFEIDSCLEVFQKYDYIVTMFRFIEISDINTYLSKIEKDLYDVIVACGGDGTVNIVLNAIIKNDINSKLGIVPSGTANDFASFLKIPREPAKACKIITDGNSKYVDVGLANDIYFINVFAAGLFTNISHVVDKEFKDFFGKFAYYLKGIEQIPNFTPIPIVIENSKETIKEDIYLFFILNSSGTGGFENLAKGATIDDGMFEFVGVRARPIGEIAILFVKILTGDYLDDPNVIYFKDNYIKIDTLSTNPNHFETDLDGENGPELPVEIRNIPKKIEIFMPL